MDRRDFLKTTFAGLTLPFIPFSFPKRDDFVDSLLENVKSGLIAVVGNDRNLLLDRMRGRENVIVYKSSPFIQDKRSSLDKRLDKRLDKQQRFRNYIIGLHRAEKIAVIGFEKRHCFMSGDFHFVPLFVHYMSSAIVLVEDGKIKYLKNRYGPLNEV